MLSLKIGLKFCIKNLWECGTISDKRLVKVFPTRNSKRRTLDDFLRKLRTAGSIERTVND